MQTETATDLEQDIILNLQHVRAAVRKMIGLTDPEINAILHELADLTLDNSAFLLAHARWH